MEKNFLRLFSIIAFFLLAVSCSEEDGGPGSSESAEMRLGENTILLNEQQLDAVVSVDNDVLVLNNTIKEDDLPQVGQILLTSEVNENMPSGFLGRVTRVEEEGATYRIETEPAALDEAFDRLVLEQTIDLVPVTRASISKDEDGFYCFEQSVSVKQGKATITGTANLGLKLNIHIDINNRIHKPYGYVILQSKFSGDLDFSLFAEGKFELMRHPIGNEIPLSASISNIIITPALQLYGVIEGNGKVSVNAGVNYSKQMVNAVSYKDGIWEGNVREMNNKGNCDLKVSKANMTLEGNFFAGIATAVKLKVCNNENMKIMIEPKFGLNESGNFVFDLTESDFFNRHKDSKINAGLGVKVDAKADASIFGEGAELNASIFDETFFEKESYLFPSFENTTIKVDKSSRSAYVNYSVNRDLLFASQVGLALYRDENLVARSASREYMYNEKFENPLSHTFDGLEENTQYTVCPYVMWGNTMYKAEPRNRFDLDGAEEPEGGDSGIQLPDGTDFSIVGSWSYITPPAPVDQKPYECYITNTEAVITFAENGEYSFTIYTNPVVSGYGRWEYDHGTIKMNYTYYNTPPSPSMGGMGGTASGSDRIYFDYGHAIQRDSFVDGEGVRYTRIPTVGLHHNLEVWYEDGGYYIMRHRGNWCSFTG